MATQIITVTPANQSIFNAVNYDSDPVIVLLDTNTGAVSVKMREPNTGNPKEYTFKNIGSSVATVDFLAHSPLSLYDTTVTSITITSGSCVNIVNYVTGNKWILLDSDYDRFGGQDNYLEIEDDGTLELIGSATVWDDVYPSSVNVGAGSSIPSFSVYAGSQRSYEFLGTGATTKDLQIGYQLYHGYKEQSTIIPHIHLYIPDNASGGVIKFGTTWRWNNVWDTGAISETTTYGTVTRGAAEGISNNHILSFGAIVGTGKKISSVFTTRLFRDPADVGDTFAASVWLISADIHIEKDGFGSRQDLVK